MEESLNILTHLGLGKSLVYRYILKYLGLVESVVYILFSIWLGRESIPYYEVSRAGRKFIYSEVRVSGLGRSQYIMKYLA